MKGGGLRANSMLIIGIHQVNKKNQCRVHCMNHINRLNLASLLVFLSACTIPIYHIPKAPLEGEFSNNPPFDMKVAVYLSNELMQKKSYISGGISTYDKIGSNVVDMAKKIFTDVVVVYNDEAMMASEVDAVLEPEKVDITQHVQRSSFGMNFTIRVHWKMLANDKKTIIYSSAIEGKARNYAGSMFNIESQLIKRVHIGFNDLLIKTYTDLVRSYSLHQYATIPSIVLADPAERTRTASELINRQKNLAQKNAIKLASLYYGIDTDDKTLVKTILDSDTDPNQYDSYHIGYPLHASAYNGNNELVLYLLQRNADINAQDKEGKTLLYYYVATNNQPMIQEVLIQGAVIIPLGKITSESYVTALSYHAAAKFNQKKSLYIKSKENYILAKKYYDQSVAKFEVLSSSLTKKKRRKELMKTLLLGLANATVSYGNQKQVSMRQKQNAQIQGLQHANKTGAGYQGYINYMNDRKETQQATGYQYFDNPQNQSSQFKHLSGGTLIDLFDQSAKKNRVASLVCQKMITCYNNASTKDGMALCARN